VLTTNQKVKYLVHEIDRNNYFEFWGHSQEDGPDNNKINVVERYYFLVGIPLNIIRNLLENYGQYSILYSGPETDGNVFNYQNSGPVDNIGTFHPNRIAQFYSKNLGRPIVFEVTISGAIGLTGALQHGIKEVPGIRKSRKWISKTVKTYSF
jgi:hypothetical protein